MVQCTAVHIKESSSLRILGGGLGSLGPLTHMREGGTSYEASRNTKPRRLNLFEAPNGCGRTRGTLTVNSHEGTQGGRLR